MNDMTLHVNGRGRLRAKAQVWSGGILIRLDDDARLEFWAEIDLTEAQLMELLQAVREQRAAGAV